MSSNLYSIGLSGLQSSTARISTTGQNTANVDTEGYSRQKTSTVSIEGGGVRIQDTGRVVNQYMNQQVWSDSSDYHYYDSYRSMMSSFDSIFGEDSVSLTSYIGDAFSELQTANSDPTDSSARANAYSNFREMVAQYNELASYVRDQDSLAKNNVVNNVSTANNIASQIAELNAQIFKFESATGGTANELRDNQEQLVKELSSHLDVKVRYDDNNLMTVNLASGQPLVLQDRNNALQLTTNSDDPDKALAVKLNFGKYSVGVPSDDLGGSIGGLVAFRNEFIPSAERMLGQQALVLADTMNEQNKLGLDANGEYGNNLFSVGQIDVAASGDNRRTSDSVDVKLTSGAADEITTDTYELVMTSNTAFKIVTYDQSGRISDESDVVDTATATPNANGYFEVDGLGIEIQLTGANYTTGDKFQFAPTKNAAATLSLSARSGDDFALSAPIEVSSADSNLSDVSISISSVSNTDSSDSAFTQTGGLYPSAPQELFFTASDTVEIRDANGNVLDTLTNITDYSNLLGQSTVLSTAPNTPPGYDVSLNGTPRAGDSFSIAFNASGESDNYNGLKLASLQNQASVGGERTYSEAFTALVTEIGSVSASLATNATSSEVVMNKSVAARDEVSAVSLDEEAVNLLRFQQSYSASAQILTAAQSTFATLISALR